MKTTIQFLYVMIILLAGLGRLNAAAQVELDKPPTYDAELKGYVQENLSIPVEDYTSAIIKIDNKQIVIDGYWEFKDDAGQLLDRPKVLSQPGDMTKQVVLALRSPGDAVVTVSEGGKTKTYHVLVFSRFKENNIEKELETAILKFVGDPGLKVKILPPQASLVGANFNRSFGDDVASDILAPRGQVNSGAGAGVFSSADFRPTIILEGEVANDLVALKAINVSHAYTANVVNLMNVRNPVQVKIAVKVIQVTHTKDSHIGLTHRSLITNQDGTTSSVTTVGNGQPGFGLGFSSSAPFFETGSAGSLPIFGANLPGSINTTVNLAELGSTAKLMQEPTLTVLNGQPAQFLVGKTISLLSGVTFSATGVPIQQYSQESVGIALLVTPIVKEEETYRPDAAGLIPWGTISTQESHMTRAAGTAVAQVTNTISENGIVQLAVQPSISSVAPDVGGQPAINRNAVETRVAMKNGESLVIGGLFDDELTKQLETIPFLSKIPILGELFKDRANSKTTTELIFVLTPTVLGLQDLGNAKDLKPRLEDSRNMLLSEGVLKDPVKPTRISAAEVLVRHGEVEAVKTVEPAPAPEAVAPVPAEAPVIEVNAPAAPAETPAPPPAPEPKVEPKSPQLLPGPRPEQP